MSCGRRPCRSDAWQRGAGTAVCMDEHPARDTGPKPSSRPARITATYEVTSRSPENQVGTGLAGRGRGGHQPWGSRHLKALLTASSARQGRSQGAACPLRCAGTQITSKMLARRDMCQHNGIAARLGRLSPDLPAAGPRRLNRQQLPPPRATNSLAGTAIHSLFLSSSHHEPCATGAAARPDRSRQGPTDSAVAQCPRPHGKPVTDAQTTTFSLSAGWTKHRDAQRTAHSSPPTSAFSL